MRHKPRKSAPTADAAWSLAQAWGPALDKIGFLGDFHLVLLAYFRGYEDHECRTALAPQFSSRKRSLLRSGTDDLIRTTMMALPILKSKCSLA